MPPTLLRPLALLLLILLLGSPGWGAGTFDLFPAGAEVNGTRLAQVRQENLMAEAQGPLRSLHVRYRDVWQGRKRTFVWSAQSFRNPDGSLAYAVVLQQVQPKSLDLLRAGTSSLELGDFGEEDPDERYRVVYRAFDTYLNQIKAASRLAP